jgi:hypothetical protein
LVERATFDAMLVDQARAAGATACEGPLPDHLGLDWPTVFSRMAAGATVGQVVEQPRSDDLGSAELHGRQTNALLDFYLQGFLRMDPQRTRAPAHVGTGALLGYVGPGAAGAARARASSMA